jgi:hypothetical protein
VTTTLHDKRFGLVAALCLLSLALAIAPALGAGKAAKKARMQGISLLYALDAGTGTLTPRKGEGAEYKLTLKALDRSVTWFSDRPTRRSGSFPVADLAESWKGFGFAADPPNAALTYTDKAGDSGRTVILELSLLRYAKGTLSFAARVLDPKRIKSPNLAQHAAGADRKPAPAFTEASVFLDDGEAEVVNGCVIQPFTECLNLDLGEIDLTREAWGAVNFSGSDLDGTDAQQAGLEGAIFVKSSLRNSDFQLAGLQDANFSGANLEHANFVAAFLGNANFENANLAGANLTSAEVDEEEGQSINFHGANICGAAMPNGTIGECR